MKASMQNITSENLLITGITGYIGFQTLVIALERGHKVRGVIRNERNIVELKGKNPLITKSHEQGQLDFVVVPDFLKENGWNKILDGITAVIHLASPLAFGAEDYEAGIVAPAISMVTTILEAAKQIPTIRRVVVTSSCVTLVPIEWNANPDSEKLYTSSDCNSQPKRPFRSGMEAYWASKAFARMATREWVDTNKPHFDYVNLLPSVVIGPDARIPESGTTSELLQEARAAVLTVALDGANNSAFPYVGVPVHVADVARAHVDAVDAGRIPGNSEYILSSDTPEGVVWDEDIPAICQKHFPDQVNDHSLALKGSLTCIKFRLDGATTEKAFGWKFTTFEDTMREMIAQYLKLLKNTSSSS